MSINIYNRQVLYSAECRLKILEGVNALADAVAVTLGPRGKNVVIKLGLNDPKFTKDGVTVARNVFFPDQFKNMGAEIVSGVALRTCARTGDGTTTATVLARALMNGGAIVQSDVDHVVRELKAMAVPVASKDDWRNVALVSANNDAEIAAMIANTLETVGMDGQITVDLSSEVSPFVDAPGWYGTYLRSEIVKGMSLPKGYASPYFVTNTEKMTVELDNPKILVLDNYVHNWEQIFFDLNETVKSGRAILIIAREVGGEALSALVLNKVKNGVKVAAISTQGLSADFLEDVAIATGASLAERRLGSARKVIVHHNKAVIIEGAGDPEEIEKRCAMLREAKLKERLARMAGGVAVLWVGGATEAEASERRDRVDDALGATRSAIEEGIVPGGGFALLKAGAKLQDGTVKRATEAPLRRILANAEVSDINTVLAMRGFDARNLCECDMMEAGIVDPAKVVLSAFGDAVSVAKLVMNTECGILEKVKE